MASPAKQSCYDSHIVVGERRSLPQVYIGMEEDTGAGHIRHRSSDSSCSTGCATPSHVAIESSQFRNRNMTPQSDTTVFDHDSSMTPKKKKDSSIHIDSGLGESYMPRGKPKNLSSELWTSVLMSPVENIKKKIKRRPSYVDDSSKWNPDTEQVLGWIIFSLITVSLLMAGIITISSLRGPKTEVHYNTANYDSKYGKDADIVLDEDLPMMNKDFLLKDDVTVEEIYELKRQMGDDQVQRDVIVKEEIIHEEVVKSKAGNDEYFKDFEKHLFEDGRAGAMDKMKIELMEKNTQLREAEELLEEETKLLMKVSKKLEEFVEQSKSKTELETPNNVSSFNDSGIVLPEFPKPNPKPKRRHKKSRHQNPYLKHKTKHKMSRKKPIVKPIFVEEPKRQINNSSNIMEPIDGEKLRDEVDSDSSNFGGDTLDRGKRSRPWGWSSSSNSLRNRGARFRKNEESFVFDLIQRKNDDSESSDELKE